jgi:hypothetical protein
MMLAPAHGITSGRKGFRAGLALFIARVLLIAREPKRFLRYFSAGPP